MYHPADPRPNQLAFGQGKVGRLSAVPRPFLRWAGSKQALLPRLSEAIPVTFGRYYEPFLGAGALFFHLTPGRAVLSDASSELIDTWLMVRDNVDAIIEYLRPLKPNKELFYKIRGNRATDMITRAAEFLYLNKTCWNGLYRVNAKGEFNVPYGAPRSDFIFDEANLKACAKALTRPEIELRNTDFAAAVADAAEGDLVYFDPPYVTKHSNNGFRDWNEKLFSWADQERLACESARLRDRGAMVIISNANHADIADLYPGFAKIAFQRTSTLSSDSAFRCKVGEIILTANI